MSSFSTGVSDAGLIYSSVCDHTTLATSGVGVFLLCGEVVEGSSIYPAHRGTY